VSKANDHSAGPRTEIFADSDACVLMDAGKDFAKWQLPDRFEFVAAIPCTATGKFKKTELRDQFTSA
jgi:acyl-CoA synthetase (AMP-forming)/AMP-acid ligase II